MTSSTQEKIVNLTIDGIPIAVQAGTTILEAARKADVKIPTLCDCPGLNRRAYCRLCVVECDGERKLSAACANYVREGMSIVSNSLRILETRKTIVELLLANHPQECLGCVKNKKCDLQSLAATFGIRETPFQRAAAETRPREIAEETLVRDMDKCVRCGRCVEVCQEIQSAGAISTSHRSINFEMGTAYGEALAESPCNFCGQCAGVCPVGAIYGYDQREKVRSALNSSEQNLMAQLSPASVAGFADLFNLPPGTITAGKMVTALKLLGFKKTLDAGISAELTISDICIELQDRINKNEKIPMLLSNSPAFTNFLEKNYPDLIHHLSCSKSPELNFQTIIKEAYSKAEGIDISKITTVSIVPHIAKKFELLRMEKETSGLQGKDYALTNNELALLIKTAGIDFSTLPESPFDSIISAGKTGPEGSVKRHLQETFSAYTGAEQKKPEGITETEADLNGAKLKIVFADNFANARKVLESIREGKCEAALVLVNGYFYLNP
ncbi:MAG: 2Fe-2S iron-sulfur cluster-binding protein [Treponema sp.]|nr:2Fe-2S iron-sulfur cluster-binding protein [Treponema sp.]